MKQPVEFPAEEILYRLIVVRADGTRELIASGIPEDRAKELQQFLDAEVLESNLTIEPECRPELQAADSSSLAPRSQTMAHRPQ